MQVDATKKVTFYIAFADNVVQDKEFVEKTTKNVRMEFTARPSLDFHNGTRLIIDRPNLKYYDPIEVREDLRLRYVKMFYLVTTSGTKEKPVELTDAFGTSIGMESMKLFKVFHAEYPYNYPLLNYPLFNEGNNPGHNPGLFSDVFAGMVKVRVEEK